MQNVTGWNMRKNRTSGVGGGKARGAREKGGGGLGGSFKKPEGGQKRSFREQVGGVRASSRGGGPLGRSEQLQHYLKTSRLRPLLPSHWAEAAGGAAG